MKKKLTLAMIVLTFLSIFSILTPRVKAETSMLGWTIQTVDSSNDVGQANSLAFDYSGNPSISYGDIDVHDLKYAHWDGNTWKAWKAEIVDASGTPAYNKFYPQTSLAFDPTGNPAISYYNGEPYYDLRYAHWNGENWDIQTVFDDGWRAGWTRTTSLSFDKNGNPAIVFRHMYYGMRYAHWDGTNWKIELVDSGYGTGAVSSLRFDAKGNPGIAYLWQGVCEPDQYGNCKGHVNLRYAFFDENRWNIEIVDENTGYWPNPSLAFDLSGNPAISYYDGITKILKYAYWNGASWSIQVVDSTGDVGIFSSLAFDRIGNPAISYYDWGNNDLRYAYFDGTKWNIETVDSQGDVGFSNSLAFDRLGNPSISYYDATNGDLKYALISPGDNTPPTTTDNSPLDWRNADYTVTLLCTDNPGGSGCKGTWYRIDNGAWQTGNSISISAEGDHLIEYYSIDNAGNTESIKSAHARLDKTPPTITINTPVPYGIYTIGMALDFLALDSLSGVATITGTLTNTGGEPRVVSSGFSPVPGVYTLTVNAADNAGNTANSDPVFFVVYDPEGGFATGGGWFNPDSDSTLPGGRANFGFVAKYLHGSSAGNLEFQYNH